MGISIRRSHASAVCENTIYRRRRKYDRLSPSELRRLPDLGRENSQLKKLVADLSLDKEILQDVLRKNALRPVLKRELLWEVLEDYEASEHRACRLIELHRSVFYYQSRKKDDRALRIRLKEPAYSRPRHGCRRLTVL